MHYDTIAMKHNTSGAGGKQLFRLKRGAMSLKKAKEDKIVFQETPAAPEEAIVPEVYAFPLSLSLINWPPFLLCSKPFSISVNLHIFHPIIVSPESLTYISLYSYL